MNTQENISLESFITKHGIKFGCHRVDSRPDGLMESWGDRHMRHFRCRIIGPNICHVCDYSGPCDTCPNCVQKTAKEKSLLYFSQGWGHTENPTLADVLDCLASDASGYENAQSFDDWASEFGYDTDSRKRAEKTFRAIKRQAEQLKRMLGEEAYQELLWNTERL